MKCIKTTVEDHRDIKIRDLTNENSDLKARIKSLEADLAQAGDDQCLYADFVKAKEAYRDCCDFIAECLKLCAPPEMSMTQAAFEAQALIKRALEERDDLKRKCEMLTISKAYLCADNDILHATLTHVGAERDELKGIADAVIAWQEQKESADVYGYVRLLQAMSAAIDAYQARRAEKGAKSDEH